MQIRPKTVTAGIGRTTVSSSGPDICMRMRVDGFYVHQIILIMPNTLLYNWDKEECEK